MQVIVVPPKVLFQWRMTVHTIVLDTGLYLVCDHGESETIL